ncbi:NAD(P)-dependent alcohol dehydrogenase [Kineosporia sp. J2-2]|uniref:alcohol dehydrogenase (NADP(+)) n=1 Tax=Kineosporia corallincola TaxID=2835133 RepID=A0ABS5TPC4_9ACTN|nr:NAD(P)-dependent alcohol dehydrogenase [Kineosporia corallincola]MBT0772932.1 NAD(P)-dependent alcohol dehydrogenase [Kineosporia corallincola]
MPITVQAHAALERGGPLRPWSYEQRDARPHDVRIDVLFCGVCHTDLHSIGPWGQNFPLVPGHETVGRVVEIGSAVSTFALGDLVGVGPVVDSCRDCPPCRAGQESMCQQIATAAYDAQDRHGGGVTRGGFAETVVCDERFVFRIPDGLDPAAVAPLLCAGSTVYTPLKQWDAGPGTTVGIVGIGGLGHLGVKFARALGAHVVAFTTSASKAQAALALGAHEVVLSGDPAQMAAQGNRFDLLLDTVPVTHPLTPYMQTLTTGATLVSVGLPPAFDVMPFAMVLGRRSLAGAGAGGAAETREMLEFAARHAITADIETVGRAELNTALKRLEANDVKYRFVVDMKA